MPFETQLIFSKKYILQAMKVSNYYFCFAALVAFTCYTSAAVLEAEHPYLPRSREYVELTEELDTEFWYDKAQTILADKIINHKQLNEKRAKNIIMFLGDGMSVHTVTATRNFMGDSNDQVYFEKFPYLGLSKTYCVDQRTPDSACTATAYLSGVKTNFFTVGVTAQVPLSDCFAATNKNTHTESLAKWAQDAGKWAGLVTTTRVTHASPAGVYAHTADRQWESDREVKAKGCSADLNPDIARQLIESPVGQELRVVLGGGRSYFRDEKMKDELGKPGVRTDGRDLIENWLKNKKARGAGANYIWSRDGLNSVDLSKTDYLLGLFNESHLSYHGDRQRNNKEEEEPSLSEMTEAAIKVLRRNQNGYFLFVEAGRIDMAHHETKAHKSLEDTEELSRAVELARAITSEDDTLIVVTSDHAHTMTINGYPYRRQNIFSLAPNFASDELPFSILSYANGPGYESTYSSRSGRLDLRNFDVKAADHKFMATVPLSSETHGGEDVAVFASGPYAHYFTGNYEQSAIPAFMAYAANIGPFAKNKLNIN